MTRMLCISWKDKRSNWTRRARWFADGTSTDEELHSNVRINLEDRNEGACNHILKLPDEIDKLWQGFKDGKLTIYGQPIDTEKGK